ncbi:transmembrane protease serine 9-like [Alosa pseudoharengus]|uniref:transmembrane protease serine 9-like n=1 Tax=Alosa pseudoharengus TaxID=34774 RepID=UPI003F8CABBA
MGAATLLCLQLAASMLLLVSSSAQGGYAGIVNGTVAKEHSRPYMVSVQKKNEEHICGGFLVSESFVMTAAHCITWGVDLTVVVGGHDITNQKSGTRIPVKYYHVNPGYIPETQNDIAILQLTEGAKQSNSVKWISIPEKDKDIKGAEVCSVAGWGATKTKGPANNLLLQADVVIMKRKECNQLWKGYFSEKMLCASGKAGFCQGDSGGPLVCKNKAVGVVSFYERNNCNNPKMPNVYTRISAYLPWIKSILKSVKQSAKTVIDHIGEDVDELHVSYPLLMRLSLGVVNIMGAATLLCLQLAASMLLLVFSSAQGGYVGIVNGKVAKNHSRPYMVSVQKNKGHFCGGFLVSESFVMTAAHCITWGVDLTVVVGGHDITNQKSGTRIPVKYYHVNPGYIPETLQNDIAILQLTEGVKQSNSVKWISIPKKNKDIKGATNCSVAGWGATKTNGPPNNLLLEANVLIMKRQECKKLWKTYLSEKMLCASGRAGFCQGDSGGPLVCKNKAVGVVSFTDKNCNNLKKPNVYTRISAYLPWIKSILKSV